MARHLRSFTRGIICTTGRKVLLSSFAVPQNHLEGYVRSRSKLLMFVQY